MNSLKETEPHNDLYIVCPFCRLEYFLRTKFGDNIFIITVPAVVLNSHHVEDWALNEFLKREKITDIYLVSDTSCNFIEEAINGDKEFGLNCEIRLRELCNNLSIDLERLDLLCDKKELLAKSIALAQIQFLKAEFTFKDETTKINIHGMITDKNSGYKIIN
ncbi:MAG: hypothetical protein ABIP79_04685 [Chitinophagaceae bacterium]